MLGGAVASSSYGAAEAPASQEMGIRAMGIQAMIAASQDAATLLAVLCSWSPQEKISDGSKTPKHLHRLTI
jgi:hypothetical protein